MGIAEARNHASGEGVVVGKEAGATIALEKRKVAGPRHLLLRCQAAHIVGGREALRSREMAANPGDLLVNAKRTVPEERGEEENGKK